MNMPLDIFLRHKVEMVAWGCYLRHSPCKCKLEDICMLLPQVEVGVYITGDLLIALRMDDLLKLLGDEVVEGVYVLLD